MEPFSVQLGSFVIKVNPQCIVLFPRSNDGRHFTQYFKALKGLWKPHITLPRLKRKRIPLGSWSAGAGRKLNETLSEAWGKAWIAALRSANLEQLDAEGWFACHPTEEDLLCWVDKHVKSGAHTYKINGKTLDQLRELEEPSKVRLLNLRSEDCNGPICIYLPSGAGANENRFLAFLRKGVWGDAGWYWWPSQFLSSEEVLKPLFAHCGPSLVEALRTMNRWLRLGWKEDALADFDRWASPTGG